MTETDEFEIDVIRICKALWKKAWAIVLCAIVLGGGVLAYSRYTYVPMYAAKSAMRIGSSFEKQYIFEDNTGRVTASSLSEARSLVATCGAMLKTRTVLEKVVDAAGVNTTPEALAGMITVEAIDKTELFRITVTSNDPEEAAQIANAVTQVLPEEMAAVNGVYAVHTMDTALTPQNSLPNKITRNAVIAALLGAILVCAVISVSDIWKQVKDYNIRFRVQA